MIDNDTLEHCIATKLVPFFMKRSASKPLASEQSLIEVPRRRRGYFPNLPQRNNMRHLLAGCCAADYYPIAERRRMMNPFIHIELNSPDPDKSKAFYGELFQWQLEATPNSPVSDDSYTVIKVGEGTGGGIMKQVANGPAGWIPYVLVDDVRASTDKAESLGGKVMKGVTEMPEMGWFSIIQDPTGSVLGLWQHNPKMLEAEDKAKEKALTARKQSAENPARAHQR
jgi:uncharacterized protein